jgi:hypothetical protein
LKTVLPLSSGEVVFLQAVASKITHKVENKDILMMFFIIFTKTIQTKLQIKNKFFSEIF